MSKLTFNSGQSIQAANDSYQALPNVINWVQLRHEAERREENAQRGSIIDATDRELDLYYRNKKARQYIETKRQERFDRIGGYAALLCGAVFTYATIIYPIFVM